MVLRVALAQLDTHVGDIGGNVRHILEAWRQAADLGADLVIFPEVAVTGSPPLGLLRKPDFVAANLAAMDELIRSGPASTVAAIGYIGVETDDPPSMQAHLAEADPTAREDAAKHPRLTSAAAIVADNSLVATASKANLTPSSPSEEMRYLVPGQGPTVISLRGVRVSFAIGSDAWASSPRSDGAESIEVVAHLDASPFHRASFDDRMDRTTDLAREQASWVASCNPVGGQDEVVFDGRSLIANPNGEVAVEGASFRAELIVLDLDVAAEDPDLGDLPQRSGFPASRPALPPRPDPPPRDELGEVWQALMRATADYLNHNGFQEALVGLSGGIDSAIVATLAVDSLGAENVTTVAMPSPYSPDHSVTDAKQLADRLGCRHLTFPIDGPLAALRQTLAGHVVTGFSDRPTDPQPGVAYENLQSRLRGLVLMTLSNEHGALVLTTGNRSEYAVGYSTLYGDMAGGFAPIKDISKLLVYELARWRNRNGEIIPRHTIDKPPSAELRPGQRDDDSLPAYPVLDDIIHAYLDLGLDVDGIAARGHDPDEVGRLIQMIDRAAFKRHQAAPGPRITASSWQRGERMPLTHAWRD